MPPTGLRARAGATPAASASWVTVSNRSACGLTFPTGKVAAESACSPSSHTPTSTLRRSPSLRTRREDGIPWTTSWLIDVHRVAGKSRSEEHTSELQSRLHLVCRLLLEKKKNIETTLGVVTLRHSIS